MTNATNEQAIINLTFNELKSLLAPTSYNALITEELSIMLETNDTNKSNINMFNIKSINSETKEIRTRYMIVEVINDKIINQITYYNVQKACLHLMQVATELLENNLILVD